jgi:hypothetical protein
MKYLLTVNGNEKWAAGLPPDPEEMERMGKFVEEISKSGTLLFTGGLSPKETRITASRGKVLFTDGPFTEAKEMMGGFALVEVGSHEEAIELSKRFFAIHGDGAGTMREVFG